MITRGSGLAALPEREPLPFVRFPFAYVTFVTARLVAPLKSEQRPLAGTAPGMREFLPSDGRRLPPSYPGPTSLERKIEMIIAWCSGLPVSCRGSRCWPPLSICRTVIVLAVLVLAVIFAVRGYAPEAITGPVLVLVAGGIAAADRLVGIQRGRAVSAFPAL
jgi:hypothetical protein